MENTELLKLWTEAKPTIAKGYQILNKEMTIGFPGTCFPAVSNEEDSGIGSPYGDGAKKVAEFFESVVHKALLNPTGETFPPDYSPYMSTLGYNPFFTPLNKLPYLSEDTLEEIYKSSRKGTAIDFKSVAKNYNKALKESYYNFLCRLQSQEKDAVQLNNKFIIFMKNNKYSSYDAVFYHKNDIAYYLYTQFISSLFIQEAPFEYIGDVQVKIPESIYSVHKNLFLEGFTLGAPPDMFGGEQKWHFPVLDPDEMFSKKGLGPAGEILFDIFDTTFKRNKAGVRIDHYIGMVNPYVISDSKKYKNGRLYSSPEHPILKNYVKNNIAEFANISEKIIIQAAKKNKVDVDKIYIEDIGNRPPELDKVIKMLGLGRMLVSQFVEPWNPNHIYRIKNAKSNDIAAIDTHDTQSIHELYFSMNEHNREEHAKQLAEDLRWSYAPDLKEPKNLIRMKWGELMASPARRVQAFFTSFTGQEGRYNNPNGKKNWTLRHPNNFAELYFSNLKKGTAYNPFDAICLGIYARGESFFKKHESTVAKLREFEKKILQKIKD